MIEETGALLLDDLHQSSHAKYFVGLSGARAASHHQFARIELLDVTQHSAQRVRLGDALLIFARSPRVIWLDRDQLIANEGLKVDLLERSRQCPLDRVVSGNNYFCHLEFRLFWTLVCAALAFGRAA